MNKLIELIKKVKTSFNSLVFVLIIIMFLLLLEAYMYNDNTIYLLVFLIFSLGAVNEFFARANLLKIEVLYLPKERLFTDTKGKLWFAVKNFGKSSSYALEINGIKINSITPHHKKLISQEFIANKRGFAKLPLTEIKSTYPMPYLNAVKNKKSFGKLTIYPKPEGKTLYESFGIKSLKKGGDDEFEGIRPHIEGEPLSRIHWASYAKQGKWMSKEFLQDSQNNELELYYSKAGDTHEEKLSQLCLWILECEKNDIPFSLILGENIYYSEKDEIDTILDELAYA